MFHYISSTSIHSVPTNAILVNGSRFNAKQLSDVDKLKGGDILTLKNIKAVGADGKVRSLGLIQIQI